jgi:hypothetical protein
MSPKIVALGFFTCDLPMKNSDQPQFKFASIMEILKAKL